MSMWSPRRWLGTWFGTWFGAADTAPPDPWSGAMACEVQLRAVSADVIIRSPHLCVVHVVGAVQPHLLIRV